MIQLRHYQQPLKDELMGNWDLHSPGYSTHKNQFLQLSTGGGKTIIFGSIAQEFIEMGIPVLTIAHREELVTQAVEKYRFIDPSHQESDVIMGKYLRRQHILHKVGSVQTISRRIDKIHFEREPGLIIIDEAHHVKGQSYLKILERFKNSLVLCVSATPIRMSGEGFDDVCTHMVAGPTTEQMEKFWMEDPQKKMGLVPDTIVNIQLSKKMQRLKKVRGEYDAKQLNEILNTNPSCETIVKLWHEYANGKQTIGFCERNVKGNTPMVERLCRAFQESGVNAAFVTGDKKRFPDDKRKRLIEDFKNKKITVLLNVELFTEGFDVPGVEATLLCRKTDSLSLYIQMVGRGKRAAGPTKTSHILMDFAGNVAQHGPPNYPHQWTLKGMPKKKFTGEEIMVRLPGGEPMLLFDLPDYEGPVHYEIVPIEDKDRHLWKFHSVLSKQLKNPNSDKRKAAYFAYAQFIKKQQGRVSQHELQEIALAMGYKKGWGYYRFQDFNSIYKFLDKPNDKFTLEDSMKAQILLKEKFTWSNRGKTGFSPGYKELEGQLAAKMQYAGIQQPQEEVSLVLDDEDLPF